MKQVDDFFRSAKSADTATPHSPRDLQLMMRGAAGARRLMRLRLWGSLAVGAAGGAAACYMALMPGSQPAADATAPVFGTYTYAVDTLPEHNSMVSAYDGSTDSSLPRRRRRSAAAKVEQEADSPINPTGEATSEENDLHLGEYPVLLLGRKASARVLGFGYDATFRSQALVWKISGGAIVATDDVERWRYVPGGFRDSVFLGVPELVTDAEGGLIADKQQIYASLSIPPDDDLPAQPENRRLIPCVIKHGRNDVILWYAATDPVLDILADKATAAVSRYKPMPRRIAGPAKPASSQPPSSAGEIIGVYWKHGAPTLRWVMQKSDKITVALHNLKGDLSVALVAQAPFAPGEHTRAFDVVGLRKGIYVAAIHHSDGTIIQELLYKQ